VSDELLRETATRLFADTSTFAAVERAEAVGWAPELWAALATTGLAWVSVPEAAGGSGGDLADALEVLRVAGRHSVPLPLAETGVLGGWLQAGAGLTVPDGPVTVAPGTRRDDVTLAGGVLAGSAHRVPWARAVDRIVVLVADGATPMVAVVDRHDVGIEPAANLAGEPRDSVRFDAVTPHALAPAAPGVDGETVRLRGALSRVALMAGALERLSELTVEYTDGRRQFGKAVGSFQAVQEHLVHGAQDAVLVGIALDAAARAAQGGAAAFEINAAKVLADQAASSASRHAHQAHGAMGMTREYPLHHVTRRLWSWRSEFGDERRGSRALGRMVVAAGPDQLYPLVTGGTRALGVASPGAADNT
jgi:acyl-CoA dehydrogenase